MFDVLRPWYLIVCAWAVHVGQNDNPVGSGNVATGEARPTGASRYYQRRASLAKNAKDVGASYPSVELTVYWRELVAEPLALFTAFDSVDLVNQVPKEHALYEKVNATNLELSSVEHVEDARAPSKATLLAGSLAILLSGALLIFASGFEAGLMVLIYVTTCASVKFCLKIVYHHGYTYPKAISAFHLALSSGFGFMLMFYRAKVAGKSICLPTRKELWWFIVPIGLTFGLCIGAENWALLYVSTAFSEVISASGPVVTAFITWAVGLPFHMTLLLPICVAVSGCLVACWGEMSFSAVGATLLAISVVLRAVKVVLQQQLMTKSPGWRQFDPTSLMAYSCGVGSIELVIMSVMMEGSAPYEDIQNSLDAARIIGAILLSGVIACGLNLSALIVIVHLGAVGMQIISQLKAVLVVLVGMTFLDEKFTPLQHAGFGILLVGIFWYSRMKRQLDATV